MMWISRSCGWEATTSPKKVTNSWMVSGCSLSNHFAGLRIQGRIQRQGAVAVVFESVPLGSSRRQGQPVVQRLNRTFLIHAEFSRMLRWMRRSIIAADGLGKSSPRRMSREAIKIFRI